MNELRLSEPGCLSCDDTGMVGNDYCTCAVTARCMHCGLTYIDWEEQGDDLCDDCENDLHNPRDVIE